MTRGQLRRVEIIHWEDFRFAFPRNTTPTDLDGVLTSNGQMIHPYMVDNGGAHFMIFEWTAGKKDPASGQMRAIKHLRLNRLIFGDLAVLVTHNATSGQDGITHVRSDHLLQFGVLAAGVQDSRWCLQGSTAYAFEDMIDEWFKDPRAAVNRWREIPKGS